MVPEYDSQATAEALLELITHSTDWPKLATEARKYVLNEHNTKKQTEKVLQLFYKIKNSKIGENDIFLKVMACFFVRSFGKQNYSNNRRGRFYRRNSYTEPAKKG